ncbi:MAG: ABC transporter permease [Planctomycetota bacterium]|jgi:ABC-2 type transport system permease protein|nr:ABC transporter permease [Planctomycetota bacterium]
MQAIWAICRRDLIHHFTTPLAWLVLAVWTFITNGTFWYILDQAHATGYWGQPIYLTAMAVGSFVLILLAPALTMNSFAAERGQGTMQLLLTVPITELQLLIGKFLTAALMLLVLLLATMIQPAILYFVSETGGVQLLSGYLGMALCAIMFAALGTWISLLVDSPVASYVLTMGAIGVLFLVGALDSQHSPPAIATVGRVLGLQTHLDHFRQGDLRIADIAWFTGLTGIWLTLAHSALCARRIHG